MKRAAGMLDEIVDVALRALAACAVLLFVFGFIALGYLYVRTVAVVPR